MRSNAHLLARIVLSASGLAYVAFAAFFIVLPVEGAARFDTVLGSPTALSNFRSAQGGLQLGLGVFLLLAGLRVAWHEAGLWAQALTSGGFLVGRATSLLLDGWPRPITFVVIGLEVLGVLSAAGVLGLSRREARPGASVRSPALMPPPGTP
jgi:hypothetical protein